MPATRSSTKAAAKSNKAEEKKKGKQSHGQVVALAVGALIASLVGAYKTFQALNGTDPLNLRPWLKENGWDTFTIETGVTPGTSFEFLATIHVVYIFALCAVFYRQKVVQLTADDAKPVPMLPSKGCVAWWMWGHNLFMSIFSLVMLFGLIYGGILDGRFKDYTAFICIPPLEAESKKSTGLIAVGMYVFYWSKVTEFADTFIIILRNKPVIWLHKVHHLTTMSLVWHCMHHESNLPACLLCASLNCFVHVIMYFWFSNPLNFKKHLLSVSTLLFKICKEWITLSQILQFVIVIITMVWIFARRFGLFGVAGGECNGTLASETHGIALYGVYLTMFGAFFVKSYCPSKKPKSG